jgi:putative aminopeptidase FrvX
MNISENCLSFLEKYINGASPTSFEWKNQKVWIDYIKPYADKIITDSYGTAVAIVNPESKYKVVIEAHCDEISWYVKYITDDGLIYVVRNGGSDHQIAPSKWVNIHTENGVVKGFFGWPAIHTRRNNKEETSPSVENIFIEVGAKNGKEVEEMGIHVGCVITYPDTFFVLNKNKFVGRALDNRIGGFIIAQVCKKIYESKIKLPFGLYATNSVQEEIGLRGAQMITETIKPNLAIITDVTHDTTTPMIDTKKHGKIECGKGPTISYSPPVQLNFRDYIIKIAKQKNISFQREAVSTCSGTDIDSFAYSNGGVPSVLISLPLRYMHTTVETVHREDVESTIDLIYESVINLKGNETFSYFD